MKTALSIVALGFVAIAMVLVGCGNPIGDGTGSIALSLDGGVSPNMLNPDRDMDTSDYNIVIENSSSVEVVNEIVAVGGDMEWGGLTEDTYTITATARNASAVAIGEGSTSADVTAGNTTSATVTVVEYDGTGTLALTASWSSGVVSDPNFGSELDGVDVSGDWVLGVDAATYNNAAVAVGLRPVVFRLYDDGVSTPVAGFATLARIAKDATTTGVFDLTANAATGGFLIDLEMDFYADLDVATDFAEGVFDIGQTQSAQAINLTPDTLESYTVAWYKNGVSVSAGDSYSFDPSAHEIGTYRIDAIVITVPGDGSNNSGAALSWTFNVVDLIDDITFTWDPASTPDSEVEITHFLDRISGNAVNVTVPNTGSYTWEDIPAGDYVLRIRDVSIVHSTYYGGNGLADSPLISIPSEPGTLDIDFGNFF